MIKDSKWTGPPSIDTLVETALRAKNSRIYLPMTFKLDRIQQMALDHESAILFLLFTSPISSFFVIVLSGFEAFHIGGGGLDGQINESHLPVIRTTSYVWLILLLGLIFSAAICLGRSDRLPKTQLLTSLGIALGAASVFATTVLLVQWIGLF